MFQLLYINMIMDTFGALALASEPPHPTILKTGPVNPENDIIRPEMWRQIFGIAAYQIIVMALLLFTGPLTFDLEFNYLDDRFENGVANGKATLYSIMFHTFIFMQLFNEICCRKIGFKDNKIFFNFFNNGYFTAILFGTVGMQFVFNLWI